MRLRTFATLLLATAAIPAQAQDLYHGVTILDPETGTATPDSYILVEDGLIVAAGEGMPADTASATLHDFTGLWAMPGLIDTHAHLTLGPTEVAADKDGTPIMRAITDEDIVSHGARMMLSYGVTTVRNPGGSAEENALYAQQVGSGERLGPEMVWAAEVIDRSPIAFEGLATLVTPERGVADIVADQAAAGADFVKLYTGLDQSDLREGIVAAAENDVQTIGHLADVSWTTAAELGINSLVHAMPTSPNLLPQDRRESYLDSRRPGTFQFFEWYERADLDAPEVTEMIAALARHGVSFDATLVAFEPAFHGDDEALLSSRAQHAHPAMVANWESGFRFDMGWEADDHERARAVWPTVLRLVRIMHEGGVPMTIGTDFANPYVAPGLAMSREMVLHQQAGIPATAVLRMATLDAARSLGLENRIGAIRPGMEADVVFIASDPRLDLARLADVRSVLNNGELHSPENLRKTN